MSIRSLQRDTVLRTSQNKYGAGGDFTLDTTIAWPTIISTAAATANAVTWSSDGNYFYTLESDRIKQFTTPFVYGPIETSIFFNETLTGSVDNISTSRSIAVADDGSRMYVVRGDSIFQYNLSVPFQVSDFFLSGSYSLSFQNLGLPDGDIKTIRFSPDGRKMYMYCARESNLYQIELSSPWDITTALPLDNISPTRLNKIPYTLLFGNSGSSLYVSYTDASIDQFTLNPPYNVNGAQFKSNILFGPSSPYYSTGKFPQSVDLLYGMGFNSDGSSLYVAQGRTATMQINLDQPYELDTANIDLSKYKFHITGGVSGEYVPTGFDFSPDGSKYYQIGTINQRIAEFNLPEPFNPNTAVLANLFVLSNRDTAPHGLKWGNAGSSFYFYGDQRKGYFQHNCTIPYQANTGANVGFFRHFHAPDVGTVNQSSYTELNFTPDGNTLMVSHWTAGITVPVRLRTPWALNSILNGYSNLMLTNANGLDLDIPGEKLYMYYDANIHQYTFDIPGEVGSIRYNKHTTSFTTDVGRSVDSMHFSHDGANLYIGSKASNCITQWSVATPWDIGSISLVSNLNLNVVGANVVSPTALTFSEDGTKMYVGSDFRDRVYEFDLTGPWDITTASNTRSFLISARESIIGSVQFSPDGRNMYISGSGTNEVSQYRVPNAWILDNSVTNTENLTRIRVTPTQTLTQGALFSRNGKRLYFYNRSGQGVRMFHATNAWSVINCDYGYFTDTGSRRYYDSEWSSTGNTLYFTQGAYLDQYRVGSSYNVDTIDFGNLVQRIHTNSLSLTTRHIEMANNYLFMHDDYTTFQERIHRYQFKENSTGSDYDLDSIDFFVKPLPLKQGEPGLQGVQISPDSSNIFLLGPGAIYPYSLSTSGDIGTLSNSQSQPIYTYSAINNAGRGMRFSEDGTKIFLLGSQASRRSLIEIDLPTPYNLTGATHAFGSNALLHSNLFSSLNGVWGFDIGNQYAYITGYDTKSIYRYALPVPNSIIGATYLNYPESNILDLSFIETGTPGNINANLKCVGFEISYTGDKFFYYPGFNSSNNRTNVQILEFNLPVDYTIGSLNDINYLGANVPVFRANLDKFNVLEGRDFRMARRGGRYLILDRNKFIHVEQAPTSQLFFNKTEFADPGQIPELYDLQYVVLAGGGGGGTHLPGPAEDPNNGGGGGGGGGGFLEGNARISASLENIIITVGAGGAMGTPGGNSALIGNVIIAYGGGAGGTGFSPSTGVGRPGGSGGGKRGYRRWAGGANVIGQGFIGGGHFPGPTSTDGGIEPSGGGGGGGAGQNGTTNPSAFPTAQSGTGGIGRSPSLNIVPNLYGQLHTDSKVYFAGGGGGGAGPAVNGANPGGLGGGGRGAKGAGNPNPANNPQMFGSRAGNIHTGGGGGGGQEPWGPIAFSLSGNSGGSGLVVVSYPAQNGLLYEGGNVLVNYANGSASIRHIFTTSSILSKSTQTIQTKVVDYLIVAGGGAGGNYAIGNPPARGVGPYGGSGGGAGGFRESNIMLFAGANVVIPIIVGAGGTASPSAPTSGNPSSINNEHIVNGGGFGGGGNGGAGLTGGSPGGSGGGSLSSAPALPGGTGNIGGYFPWEGSPGQIGVDSAPGGGGGGGGASGISYDAPQRRQGVGGRNSTMTGSNVQYAGGGGGGSYGPVAGAVGRFGGGNGGTSAAGNAGNVNTGGGGGGGGSSSPTSGGLGGAGGSGIVVIRYEGNALYTGGDVVETNNGYTVHVFYSSNNLVGIA